MTPQFDTRLLSCKQRQPARVKSSYSPGSFRVGNGAESNQSHAPFVAWTLSLRAVASIVRSNARQSRSAMPKRGSQSIQTLSLGTSAQPAMPSWQCQARCQATYYARTKPPSANSEKRIPCQRYLSLRLLRPHPLGKASPKQSLQKNGGKRIGKAWLILTGISVPP